MPKMRAERFDLSRVAYYFDVDWKEVLSRDAYSEVNRASFEWGRIWIEAPDLPQLKMMLRADGGINIHDTRACTQTFGLDRQETTIYRAIDSPASVSAVVRRVKEAGEDIAPRIARNILDAFVQSDLALCDGDQYLALALSEEAVDPPLWLRRGSTKPAISSIVKTSD